MTAPPDRRLGQLVGRLRAADWDLTAEEIADALWLAQWVGPGAAGEPPDGPAATGRLDSAASVSRAADPAPGARTDRPGGAVRPSGPGDDPPRARRRERVSLYARGEGHPGAVDTFPIRVPMASSLPGLLGLQRALRPLRGYRTLAAPLPGPLDEDATADSAARTGLLEPVHRPGERRPAAVQLVMDTSPSMVVWERMLEELRQTCAQLGVFRDVQVRYLHRAPDGTPLVGTMARRDAGGARHLRPRPAGQFRDPTGRRLTLVVSDCVGPLWQEGRAQSMLHHWARTAPLAVVQPLPPRLWPRTALPAEPGLLRRDPATGGRTRFTPDGYGPGPGPGALPVPVLLPTAEALGVWARLLSGPGRTTVRGAAGWLLPGHPPRPAPAPGAPGTRSADELLRAFRAGASPGALRLAVHLAAVPLTLPVMQLVQRAMLPDTGPMELAEVLLSGLLWRLPDMDPDTGTGPWYEFADGVREMLLHSLDRGAAALVLKHCSDYVERHFGKGARNFSARAAAQLAGEELIAPAPPGPPEERRDAAEPELFAEVPARVVRWYRPVPVESGPVAEAERLLRLWQVQGDPSLLHQARALAGPAATAPLPGAAPAEGLRARLVLGGVLQALVGTESVRNDATSRRALLEEAADHLQDAFTHAPPDGDTRATAALRLADVSYALWQDDGDRDHLVAAARVLRALPPGTSARHLRLGRTLLALTGTGTAPGPYAEEAAAELRTACRLLEREQAPDVQRCAALLDLAAALRAAGAPGAGLLAVLDAAVAATTDDAQRLRCRTEQARAHAAADQWPEADDAYAAAVGLTARDSLRRCELLVEWGESLLGRAPAAGTPGGDAGDAADPVTRAESVLREAYAVSPGRSPLRTRAQLALGRALVLRFGRQGYLPDLYESCHLLEQAARRAPDGATRAEAWLELGTARLLLSDRQGALPVADAAAAFDTAAKEARRLPAPDGPGSVTAARALHRYGDALERMGLRRAALAAYRDGQREWRDLTGRLAEVPWAEVQATREAVARLVN
ncbi:SAV_2336 N-terminal domain-related protein [Streptomyces hesseae]|uniref:SAV_2336 N-terminal domain-related protein n=1 Tax=Streptomyces hesseae TaxID=3075519 RepID=A0ABU2SQC9_9ACTN|nr:SAV_2336 N-terminal domain-related protein [Streptomyces sp. DSM 40473]MDT0450963.1 SAV_2336 N-terminal domain-related protein [Streptomyces sp. DSM 40473]